MLRNHTILRFILILSSHVHRGIPRGPFLSVSTIKVREMYFFSSLPRATFTANLIFVFATQIEQLIVHHYKIINRPQVSAFISDVILCQDSSKTNPRCLRQIATFLGQRCEAFLCNLAASQSVVWRHTLSTGHGHRTCRWNRRLSLHRVSYCIAISINSLVKGERNAVLSTDIYCAVP